MTKFNLKGNLMILVATIIWGTSFVAQNLAMDHVGPLTFNAARFFVGGLVTLIPALIMERKPGAAKDKSGVIKAGLICGLVLFGSSFFQQTGIQYTSVGKAGFITALYVVMVPVAGLFFKRRPGFRVWLGVAAAIAGMYLLCINEGVSVNGGDMLILCSAVFFTGHILVVDKFAPLYNGVTVSSIQFFVVSALAFVFAMIFEKPSFEALSGAVWPVLFTGVLSCGVAYTLQMAAQKTTDPVVASLLFSLESIFAAVSGFFILNERLTPKELAGCALVMSAIVVAQLPKGLFRKARDKSGT